MKFFLATLTFFAAFIFPFFISAQVQTVSIPVTQDAYATYTSATTATFTNNTQLRISSTNTSTPYCRIFVQFDGIRGASYIPANAVIVSASLRLQSTSEASTDLTLQTVTSAWSQTNTGTVNPATISTNAVVTTSAIIAGAVRPFDVTTLVKDIRSGTTNAHYGWMIRKTNESSRSGYNNYSSNPVLNVQYYIPASVNSASVTHATGLNTFNGSISPTVANGATPTTRTYRWYNVSGAQIAATQNISGLNPGWYGLKVYGTTAGDTLYQGFIIGAQCEDVTVNVPRGPRYIRDATIADFPSTLNYGVINFGGNGTFKAESVLNGGVWADIKDLMKFNIWIDPALTITQANLTLYGTVHDQTRSNESEFVRVTQTWNESTVTYSMQPTVNTSVTTTLTSMSSGPGNKTVSLVDFFNVWKQDNGQNYGMMFRLKDYSNTTASQTYHSTNTSNAANFPNLVMTVSLPSCDLSLLGSTSVTLNSSNQTADISVSIIPPSWAEMPFHYRISTSAIPEMTSDYTYLNDNFYGGNLDATAFFTGTVSSNGYTFSGYEPDTYWISVFDSKGRRIYTKQQFSVQFPVLYLSQTNLSTSGQQINCTGNSGKGEIALQFDKFSAGDVRFKIIDPAGPSSFGLVEPNTTFNGNSELMYGFYVNANKLYTVISGQVSSRYHNIQQDAVVKFEAYEDSIDYTLNDTLIAKFPIGNTSYKAALSLSLGGKIVFGTKKPFNMQLFTEVQPDVNCNTVTGNYSFKVYNFFNFTPNSSVTYTVKNSAGVTIGSGTGTTGAYNYVSLPTGFHTLAYSVNGGAEITRKIFVGYKMNWDSPQGYDVVQSSALVQPALVCNVPNGQNYGRALSSNELIFPNPLPSETQSEWIWSEFSVPATSGMPFFPNMNVISLTNGLSDQMPLNQSSDAAFAIIKSPVAGKYRLLLYNAPLNVLGIPYRDFNYSDKLRFQIGPGFVLLWINETNVTPLCLTPPGNLKVRANSLGLGSSIINPRATFKCEDYKIYAELERTLSGVKYRTHADRVLFAYEEEYSKTSTLKYSVLNSQNSVVASGTSTLTGPNGSALTRNHGDNRYTLKTDTLPLGAYILEVINEKGEKFYLRFVK